MNSNTFQTSARAVDPLLRLPAVLDARGVRKSQHYFDIEAGTYTPPVKQGPRVAVWPASEVAALNAARVAGKSDTEIRALVARLVAARQHALEGSP